MTTLFEQQGVQYEMQGGYKSPCVTLPNDSNYEIGVWANDIDDISKSITGLGITIY